MHFSNLFDVELFNQMVANGCVTARSHPDDDNLLVLNYTAKVQYDRIWNEVTEQCRGLILRDDHVIARPFKKFFNLGEVETLPEGPFVAYEKVDGSLGVVYVSPNGNLAVATRGSFTSEQAVIATAMVQDEFYPNRSWLFEKINAGWTPLVEIIYPENRIVVDYHGKRTLILLGCVEVATGKFEFDPSSWVGESVQESKGLTLEQVLEIQDDNKEGYVLVWENGFRVKVKFDEYVRLHRILTGITERTIWEMLSSKMGIEKVAEYVPDEFYAWMKEVAKGLQKQFSDIENAALSVLGQVNRSAERRDQALFIVKHPNSGIIFNMLDGKDYAPAIWKMIRPEGATPFLVTES